MRASLISIALLVACESAPADPGAPSEPAVAETADETGAPQPESADHEAHAEAAEDTEPATGEGPSSYGEALSDRELTPLTALAANPSEYAGQTVKTEGEIAAVCQRMGCWMEMRTEGVEPIRVPMAGHSFFLPKDVGGRQAIVEGEVALRELSEGEREHLESEGALATAQALEINATGVVIR